MEISSERIRAARQARGWTQQQLAEIADLSLRTVQRVENQASASNETISALCAVLELSRADLLAVDPQNPVHQEAARRMQFIVPVAVAAGALLGSGGTLWLMHLLG